MLSRRAARLSSNRPVAACAPASAVSSSTRSPGRASSGRSPSAIPNQRAALSGARPAAAVPGLPQHRDGLQVAGPGGVLDVVRPCGRRRAAGRQRVGGALVRAQAQRRAGTPRRRRGGRAGGGSGSGAGRPPAGRGPARAARRAPAAPRARPSPRWPSRGPARTGRRRPPTASARRRAGADSASSSPRIAAAIASGTPSAVGLPRRPVVALGAGGPAGAGRTGCRRWPRRGARPARGRRADEAAASAGESGPSVRRRTASEPRRGTVDRVEQRPVGLPGAKPGRDHDRGRAAGGGAGGPRARARRRRPSGGRRARGPAAGCGQALEQLADRPVGAEALRGGRRPSEPGSSARRDGNTAASSPQVLGGQAAERARVQRLEVLVQGVHEQAERQLALELRGAPVEGQAPAVLGPAERARPAARSSRSRARP